VWFEADDGAEKYKKLTFQQAVAFTAEDLGAAKGYGGACSVPVLAEEGCKEAAGTHLGDKRASGTEDMRGDGQSLDHIRGTTHENTNV